MLQMIMHVYRLSKALSCPYIIHDLSHKRYKQGERRLGLLVSENLLYIYRQPMFIVLLCNV